MSKVLIKKKPIAFHVTEKRNSSYSGYKKKATFGPVKIAGFCVEKKKITKINHDVRIFCFSTFK